MTIDMKFARPYVGDILDGLKTATVRYQFEHDPEPGDILTLKTTGGRRFASAAIEHVATVPLEDAVDTLDTMNARHPAYSTQHLWHTLCIHYDRGLSFTDPVHVIHFEVLGRTREASDD